MKAVVPPISRRRSLITGLVPCALGHVALLWIMAADAASLDLGVSWRALLIQILIVSAAVGMFVATLPHGNLFTWFLRAAQLALFCVLLFAFGDLPFLRPIVLGMMALDVFLHIPVPWDVGVFFLFFGAAVLIGGTPARLRASTATEDLYRALRTGGVATVVAFVAFVYERLRRSEQERQRMVEQMNLSSIRLMSINADLQEYIVTHENLLLEQERNRISRDLHDTVGYAMMNIVALLQAADDLAARDSGASREFLHKSIAQAKEGLKETRATLRLLRGITPQHVTIAEAVRRLADAFDTTNILIQVGFGNCLPSYGADRDRAVSRFVQEAIVNAIKHGNATMVQIYFWVSENVLIASVQDNGVGLPAGATLTEGIGLQGMRERLAQVGGEIAVAASPAGFKITARVPVPVEDTTERGKSANG